MLRVLQVYVDVVGPLKHSNMKMSFDLDFDDQSASIFDLKLRIEKLLYVEGFISFEVNQIRNEQSRCSLTDKLIDGHSYQVQLEPNNSSKCIRAIFVINGEDPELVDVASGRSAVEAVFEGFKNVKSVAQIRIRSRRSGSLVYHPKHELVIDGVCYMVDVVFERQVSIYFSCNEPPGLLRAIPVLNRTLRVSSMIYITTS